MYVIVQYLCMYVCIHEPVKKWVCGFVGLILLSSDIIRNQAHLLHNLCKHRWIVGYARMSCIVCMCVQVLFTDRLKVLTVCL